MSTRGYHLRLLGGAAINVGHGAPAPLAVGRHPLALAAILAAETGGTVTRDKLMALLWPEADTERARRRLRVALHALRQALGQEAIVSVADGLRLDTTRVRCDVVDFCSALEAGQPELAVRAYGGPFLDGFHLPDSLEFDQWAEAQRDRLARLHRGALEQMAEASAAAGELSVEHYRALRIPESKGDSGDPLTRHPTTTAASRSQMSCRVPRHQLSPHLARRYDEALAQARRAIELDPDFMFAYDRLHWAYDGLGRYHEAVAAAERAAELSGATDMRRRAFLAHAYGFAGRRAEARVVLDDLLSSARTAYVPPTAIAAAYVGLGDNTEAVRWLERGLDGRDGDMVLLKTFSLWDPLRDDPRFGALMERMNYPERGSVDRSAAAAARPAT